MQKRKALVALGVAASVATGGTAWALWSVNGSAMSSGTATEARLEVTATPVSDLYPGGYRPATLTVRNPNVYSIQVGQFSVVGVGVDPDHAGCPAYVVELDPMTANPQAQLPPLAEQQFEVGVGLDETAPESCKGARFDIEYGAQGWVG